MRTRAEIEQELHAMMNGSALGTANEEQFNRLAREIFAIQFAGSQAYETFCRNRGVTPDTLRDWREIPAVPARAFKEMDLITTENPIAHIFETSGTTQKNRGRHHLTRDGLNLYRASMIPTFRHYVLPELEDSSGARDTDSGAVCSALRSSLLPVVLGPRAEDASSSSLYYMLDGVCHELFTSEPVHVFGEKGVDRAALHSALSICERDGRSVFLMGTSLAFQAVCDQLSSMEEAYYLTEGSRVMETGGSKGLARATTPESLRVSISDCFGIDPVMIASEYGMTELSSQFYETTIRERWVAGPGCGFEEAPEPSRSFAGPPWVRTLIRDPENLQPIAPGQTGVLQIVDLANMHSIASIQTEDLARTEDQRAGVSTLGGSAERFSLLGRAEGAEARGCSLVAEEWARASQGATQ